MTDPIRRDTQQVYAAGLRGLVNDAMTAIDGRDMPGSIALLVPTASA